MADFITAMNNSRAGSAMTFPSTTVCTQAAPGDYCLHLKKSPVVGDVITIQNETVTNTTAQIYPSHPNTITGGDQAGGFQTILPQAKHVFTWTAGSPSSWIVT